ncbi:uncharacterized protein ALTATR162_LOCUS11793 [Alternaria atra]|uniref:Zn(2)-C6 fungal-type domain-containing protein n=1 Tax=Alternaria atra TaxID=119953 RepID=A0A8J2IDT9_9PLEO|nr:uncharacterized protein ALTATR162_LOCUS11793 [Alternaria atra]CAG5187801.1 unnamed protein product [Alternaria atra]
MPVPLRSLTKEAECTGRIEGWLGKLEIKGHETDEGKGNENAQDERAILGLRTPKRQPNSHATLDETSPTYTSFSGQSIFDVPLRRNLFGSPTPKCEIRDDDSDTTRINSDDWTLVQEKEHALERPVPPNFSLLPSAPSASLDSCGLASDVSIGEVTPVPGLKGKPALLTQVSNEPRPVWITSCLQCTIAGLPCSRTYPYCSRCQRSGRAEECLLHRRCFVSEAPNSTEVAGRKAPLLLKVVGEDDGLWKRKVELAEELCEKWVRGQDKKNWVLPDINSRRRGWRTRKDGIKKDKTSHPGEGIGRLSFRELFVDMND